MISSNNKENKLAAYIGFAIKAGKVMWGIDNIIGKKKLPLVILKDKTLSQNSAKKLALFAESKKIRLIECENLDKYTAREAKVIGISEPNLAAAIKGMFKGE